LTWDHLTTEAAHPDSVGLDRLTPLEAARLMNRMDREVAFAVEAALPEIAAAVEKIGAALRNGGRIFYIGAGTSGRLGVLDASECPPTFNSEPERVQGIIAGGDAALRRSMEGAEDDASAGASLIREKNVGLSDVVVGISASGSAPFVREALRIARERGATTIGIANNRPAALEAESDLAILAVTGPEILSGSTRLKAGTAQKMILNMLSTLGMAQSGKVYGNLMVDVRPTNRKLRDRAVRIVRQACGCTEPEALSTLEASHWRVKTAIVMHLSETDAAHAEKLLEKSGGFIRAALEESVSENL
jgi:N-acetylmuramic acid 6-phosphate etherase